ncbi:MAG: hypothetical protein N2483_10420 [Burkholderiaceae bacterium]|nr:hypothetical protein [Burkholderiaceae bacterium]
MEAGAGAGDGATAVLVTVCATEWAADSEAAHPASTAAHVTAVMRWRSIVSMQVKPAKLASLDSIPIKFKYHAPTDGALHQNVDERRC